MYDITNPNPSTSRVTLNVYPYAGYVDSLQIALFIIIHFLHVLFKSRHRASPFTDVNQFLSVPHITSHKSQNEADGSELSSMNYHALT